MFINPEQERTKIPTRVIKPQEIKRNKGGFTTVYLFLKYGHRGEIVLVRPDGQRYEFEEVHLVPGVTVIRQDVGSIFSPEDKLEIEVRNWDFGSNTFLVATEIRRAAGTT